MGQAESRWIEKVKSKLQTGRRSASQRQVGSLAEGFGGGRPVTSEHGTCYVLTEVVPGEIVLPRGRTQLLANLRLVHGVGPKRSESLTAAGVDSLRDLCDHPRWGETAQRILEAIDAGDVAFLRSCGAGDEELLGLFSSRDVAIMDIESTGLDSARPLFLVGILHMSDSRQLRLVQYLARHYDEERAVLSLAAKELTRFQVLLSYNGKSFDAPYFLARCRANLLPYRPRLHHVDLLHHVRRRYREVLPDCRLCSVESGVCGTPRADDIPSEMIPQLYHDFVASQDPRQIAAILRHNVRDLVTLSHLTRILWG